MFENSPSLSITPSTKANVSSLIDFPSPKIKSPKKLLANYKIFDDLKSSKTLTSMQLLHKKRRPWSKAEKQLALTLYYKSPSSYKYMRKNGIILPGESTVRRMLQSIAYVPGFLPEYSDQLILKIKAMSEVEKKCVILFDEMAIMKCIEYNKNLDMIEGFEDKGPLGRSSKYAKHALKFPLCYFLTCNGMTGDELNIIIKSCIKKMLDIGLLPTALVCDQGTQNRKLFSLLGGTENCPKTSIHDIVKTYDIDRRSATARTMCKITPSHLNPNPFKKMSCKLALQIFSNSVASAIKTCVHTKELKSQTALNTADFLLELNNTFDSCNSQQLNDKNPNRRPMSVQNRQIFENINKTISTFKVAKKLCHKNNIISVPPCFTGMILSLNALILLYEREKIYIIESSDKKTFFLFTGRLNQDPLENIQKMGITEIRLLDYFGPVSQASVHLH
ncbi:hypothetical protein AGLY_017323 [Aphis glycines]|uniref:Transposable element P transposase n=1 Tax=Aphis glycines TaxID=307491 RepID=A0A6G0SV63_APHGL|nr:hypothetical protein AGLY_017323 [Aphis glycines]